MSMRTEHRVTAVSDGKRIVTIIDGEASTSRWVSTKDWHDVIVPGWIRGRVFKDHVTPATGEEVWIDGGPWFTNG